MANRVDNLRMILDSVRTGKLTPASAKRWAERASRGENIGILAACAPMPSREHLGPRAMAQLQAELVSILAGAGGAADPDAPEYAELWPDDPVAAREEEIRAAARRADQLSDAEIYSLLFGDGTGET